MHRAGPAFANVFIVLCFPSVGLCVFPFFRLTSHAIRRFGDLIQVLLSQVHKAVLKDGSEVAVKVLHPDVQQQVAAYCNYSFTTTLSQEAATDSTKSFTLCPLVRRSSVIWPSSNFSPRAWSMACQALSG
jgi:hypothetical protein